MRKLLSVTFAALLSLPASYRSLWGKFTIFALQTNATAEI